MPLKKNVFSSSDLPAHLDDPAIGAGGPGVIEIPFHDETHVGWTVGAGIEHAFTDRWIARAEYRYSDFGSQDLSLAAGLPTETSVDLKAHDIRVGLSYKF